MRVLAIGSHPDDIEIGCGGSLAKHIENGDIVSVLILTTGEKGGQPKKRVEETVIALRSLGLSDITFGEFPDTTGYQDDNFGMLEAEMEDPGLWPYMQKCLDCVTDYIDKKYERAVQMYPGEIEKFVHWPRFGGKIFAVTGHVTVKAHKIILVN